MADNSIGEDLRLLRKKLSGDLLSPQQKLGVSATAATCSKRTMGADGAARAWTVPSRSTSSAARGPKARFAAVAKTMDTSMIAVFERALELVEKEARVA